MKKKMYEKPSLEVVKVQTSVAMLAGSAGLETPSDYTKGDDPFAEP